MKKLLLVTILTFSLSSVFAQSTEEERAMGTTTKSGQKILPQKGDFAMGIDATSFLKYAGNMFNGKNDNDAPFFEFSDNIFTSPTIYGKYFLEDNRALRVKLHIGFGSETDKTTVSQKPAPDNDDELNPATVTDEKTIKRNGLGITAGYEFRRGYGRLQGFFGPEVGIGFNSSSISYEYGNKMNEEYINANGESSRKTKETNGTTLAFQVGGFAGVEYFVAPKLSIGAEVGLGVKYTNVGKSEITADIWNADNKSVKEMKREEEGAHSTNFGAAYSAALNVTFHF